MVTLTMFPSESNWVRKIAVHLCALRPVHRHTVIPFCSTFFFVHTKDDWSKMSWPFEIVKIWPNSKKKLGPVPGGPWGWSLPKDPRGFQKASTKFQRGFQNGIQDCSSVFKWVPLGFQEVAKRSSGFQKAWGVGGGRGGGGVMGASKLFQGAPGEVFQWNPGGSKGFQKGSLVVPCGVPIGSRGSKVFQGFQWVPRVSRFFQGVPRGV